MAANVDRGWAWVVLAAVFVMNMLLGGFNYSTGITYVIFLEVFPEEPLKVAMAGFLFGSISCVTAPKLVLPVWSAMADDIDRAWAWMVLAAVFVNMLLLGGLVHCTGLTYILFLQVFPDDPLQCAMSGSLLISLACVAGIIGGILAGMTSCRSSMLIGSVVLFAGLFGSSFATNVSELALTFGAIAGIGSGIIYTPAISSIGFYFEKRRDFASGVALAGVGAGLMVLPPLITLFADLYGWRGLLLMLAGLLLHTFPLSALIRPSTLEKTPLRRSVSITITPFGSVTLLDTLPSTTDTPPVVAAQSEGDNLSFSSRARRFKVLLGEIFVNKPFLLFNASVCVYGAGYAAVNLYFPSFLTSLGEGRHWLALLISLGGVSNMAARIMTGMVTQNKIEITYVVYIGTIGLAGVFTMASPLMCQTKAGQVVFACALGFYSQGNISLLNSMTVDMLRIKLLPVGFGILMVTMGAGFLLGPVVVGTLIETFQSYTVGLLTAGALLILSSVTGMVMAAFKPVAITGWDTSDTPNELNKDVNNTGIDEKSEQEI